MNKKEFKEKLQNKNYYECNNILRNEIIKFLEEKINEKDKYFSYSTTKDLYNKALKCLDKKNIQYANILYKFDLTEDLSEEIILDQMMNIYNEIFCN